MQQDLDSWLKLHLTPGIGPALVHRLLDRFGSPAAACGAGFGELSELGLPRSSITQLQTNATAAAVDTALHWAQQPRQRILTLLDSAYPPLLRAIHQPPPLLYVKGDHGMLSEPQLAIVCSRNPSRGGA
jgi:DNA processing protein